MSEPGYEPRCSTDAGLSGTPYWFWAGHCVTGPPLPHDLPDELFDRLGGWEFRVGYWLRRYPTREAAVAALEEAKRQHTAQTAGTGG